MKLQNIARCLAALLLALTAGPVIAGTPQPNKYVILFYLTMSDFWVTQVQTANDNVDSSQTSLNIGKPWTMPQSSQAGYYGNYGVFHWWGTPDWVATHGGSFNSYRFSTNGVANESLINSHATQIQGANVDIIAIDATNFNMASIPSQSTASMDGAQAVLDTYLKFNRTLKVTFFANNSTTVQYLWDRFYSSGKYAGILANIAGKPLMLLKDVDSSPVLANFSVKKLWGVLGAGAATQWTFKEATPLNSSSPVPTCYANDWPEERSAAVACQSSTMYPGFATAQGRQSGNYLTWNFSVARGNSPTFVFVTSWNEWGAQNLQSRTSPIFTDAWLTEYSADIEPMSGGHGNYYVDLLGANASKFKWTTPNLALRDSSNGRWYLKYYYSDGRLAASNYAGTFDWVAGTNYQPFVGDFNRDGFGDIGVRDQNSGTWYFAERFTGTSSTFWFNNLVNYTWLAGPTYQPLSADIDGDGNFDLVLRDYTTGTWYFKKCTGNYGFSQQYTFSWLAGANYQPVIADFNGDGKPDLALRDSVSGRIYFATQNAGAFTFTAQSTTMQWVGGSNFQAFAGDFQRDGKGDLGLRDVNSGSIYLTNGWGDLTTFNNDDNLKFKAGATLSILALPANTQ